MDPYKFNKICEELLHVELKQGIFSNPSNPASYRREGSTRLALRPLPRICRDCQELVTNRSIEYYLDNSNEKTQEWIKKCSHCNKKTPISLRKINGLDK